MDCACVVFAVSNKHDAFFWRGRRRKMIDGGTKTCAKSRSVTKRTDLNFIKAVYKKRMVYGRRNDYGGFSCHSYKSERCAGIFRNKFLNCLFCSVNAPVPGNIARRHRRTYVKHKHNISSARRIYPFLLIAHRFGKGKHYKNKPDTEKNS